MRIMVNNEAITLEQYKDIVGCKGNIKKHIKGTDMVGLVFKSKKSFPKLSECEDGAQYVRVGECVKVMTYDEISKDYNLVNLDLSIGLDNHHSWFKIDDTELDYLLRRGNTK